MKCKMYLLNWLRNQGKGGSEPVLQDKEVTITTNTTTTIEPDSGYDGLSIVEVTTNVASNKNARVNPNIIGTNTVIFNNIIELPDLVFEDTRTSLAGFFNRFQSLVTAPNIDTKNIATFQQMFMNCDSLVSVPVYDTTSLTNMRQCFANCISIETAPALDTTNVTTFYFTFNGCTELKNVPAYDWTSVTDLQGVFAGCYKLTNESLNNILSSCISATSYTGTKTLAHLSIITYSNIIPTLSNYQTFLDAGWTIN